jgi:hypothetical protein
MDKIFTGLEVEFIKGGTKLTSRPLDPVLGEPWTLELKRKHQIVGSIAIGWEETRRLLFYLITHVTQLQFDDMIIIDLSYYDGG